MEDQFYAGGVRFVRKSRSLFMRVISGILRITKINPDFNRYWTTIGSTIYFPDYVDWPLDDRYAGIREHEFMHIVQFNKYGLLLMACLYLFFPLPFLLSGRWLIERGPYLHDILNGRISVHMAVAQIWEGYGWPWPRTWMLRWFSDRVLEASIEGGQNE